MNYYNILNLNENATQQDIEDNYYKSLKELHPDSISNIIITPIITIEQLQQAYDTLSNIESKIIYDYTIFKHKELNIAVGIILFTSYILFTTSYCI